MPTRVLNVVWGSHPHFRVEKTSRILVDAGMEVDILCHRSDGSAWNGGQIYEAPFPTYRFSHFGDVFLRSVLRNAVHFSFWRRAVVSRLLRAKHYDVVHWNDLTGALEAAKLARKHRIPMILDLHENYPYNIWSTERDVRQGRVSLARSYNLNSWFRYEKASVEAADLSLVTIEEMAHRLIGMHGVPPEKLVVVQNAEPIERWRDIEGSEELRQRYLGKTVMLYVGSCSPHRGLDTVIRAMADLRDRLPNLLFVIVGDGVGIPAWRRMATELGVSDRVVFEGQKPFHEARRYFGAAHFTVIPHHQYGQTDNTVPHKLYQSMAAGVPVLVSSCHSLQRIIWQTRAGLVFDAGVPRSAAERIVELMSPSLREELGRHAVEAVRTGPFTWASAAANLLKAYSRVLNPH